MYDVIKFINKGGKAGTSCRNSPLDHAHQDPWTGLAAADPGFVRGGTNGGCGRGGVREGVTPPLAPALQLYYETPLKKLF